MGPLIWIALCLLLAASSCAGDDREEVLVFAAASLTDVMDRLGERYAESERVKVIFNLGGSTDLAQQIIRGAPADAFVSAGPWPMDELETRGLLLEGSRVDLLTNELVLVGRPGAAEELEISSVEDLAEIDARVAIADPELAPAGRYAREALENLGLWELIRSRLVFGLNVRFTLGYVESGNVDVGIVYRTDTRILEGIEILAPFPEGTYPIIVYPSGVVKRSRHAEAASRFLAYLQGDEARDTFREYGFTPLKGR